MKIIYVLVIAILLVGCKEGKYENIAFVVVTAEACGVDTREFYALATDEEKAAVLNAKFGVAGTRSCSGWNYGDKEKRSKAYNVLINNINNIRKRR